METTIERGRERQERARGEVDELLTAQEASRERIANRLRQLWQGLERFEETLHDWDLEAPPPELSQVFVDLSPRRHELIGELMEIEHEVRAGTRAGLPELWKELERAIGLVTAYEAAVTDVFLQAFWLDLGVGD